jgi:hypothetical protein
MQWGDLARKSIGLEEMALKTSYSVAIKKIFLFER